MPRGGKRKGAGRKKGEPTKRMSVPVSLVGKFRDFINQWKKGNENTSKKDLS